MIPQGDPDLTAYLNELLRTNKPEQQNNTFRFPTSENPGKPEDHTPIQTRIVKELNELRDKEKLNPQETTESGNKFLERFDSTDTLLTETEKQTIEDFLVEYHDIFARDRIDIGMNTEFKVKLTPKNDKAVYSQCLPMPIHLREKPNCRISSNAQIRSHHTTAILQVRKSHICKKEAEREITFPCGSPENQQFDRGWLY